MKKIRSAASFSGLGLILFCLLGGVLLSRRNHTPANILSDSPRSGGDTVVFETRRVPAEWESQQSLWMAWPTYNNKHDWDARATYAEILELLITDLPVDLCVNDSIQQQQVQDYLFSKGFTADQLGTRIRFHIVPYGDIWLRDTGPVFVLSSKGLQAVDFDFNCWGWGSFIRDPAFPGFMKGEESVDRAIAARTNAIPVKSSLILEGGALEFNGKGTVIVSEDVVFQRNPTWGKAGVEAEFLRLFGTKKVIWLKGHLGNDAHPVLNSPYEVELNRNRQLVYTLMTTNGHTDEFVRFTASNTVLLATPPSEKEAEDNPIASRSRAFLLQVQHVLSSATDQDGKPIQVRWMPEPLSMFVGLDRRDEIFNLMTGLDFESVGKPNINPARSITGVLASSYLNYIVTNRLVLVAKYGDLYPEMAKKDEEARRELQHAFPGRRVVGIDCRAINAGGGGIHCITRQLPKQNQSLVSEKN
jgi:agmatine deiminase